MADRYSEDRFFGPEDQYQVSGAPRARFRYSSAHDYAAAGEDIGDEQSRGWRGGDMDRRPARSYRSEQGFGRSGYDRDSRGGYGRDRGYGDRDRGFFERAGDEVRSWFGDDEAERRREADMRYDDRTSGRERASRGPDDHYQAWRRSRIDELDRDYDEYRRENAERFHNEFTSWRTERQGQRDSLRRVNEHMDVVGSDGAHVGTVDKVRGDRILLTKSDPDSGGHHHSIPSRWVQSVDGKVTLRKTAEEAQNAWREEERSGALFGGGRDARDDRDWRGEHNLNRSFPGTY